MFDSSSSLITEVFDFLYFDFFHLFLFDFGGWSDIIGVWAVMSD